MESLGHVLWIGGAPGSGKTTVATALARRYGLRRYNADAHTWSHRDRAIAAGNRAAIRWEEMTIAERLEASPEEALELNIHWERGPMIVDDVRELPASPLIVAEGTTVLPDIVSGGIADRSRALWLLPTLEFQRARLNERDVPAEVRRHRDRTFLHMAKVIADRAQEHDVPVLTVDGSHGVEETIAAVERHFRDALAEGPRAETVTERRALLRSANGAMVSQVRAYLARPWSRGDPESFTREFVCECDDPECRAVLVLPVAAFERAAVSGPVVAPAH